MIDGKTNIMDTLPTSTVTPIRVCAYQATRRPTKIMEQKTITAFGSVSVTGRLGQAHADFLDCAMHCADDHKTDSVGRLQLLIDPHKLRMAMGGGKSKYSAEQTNILKRDLKEAVLDIKTPNLKIMGGIIDEIREAKGVDAEDKRRWDGSGRRQMMLIIFSTTWTSLLEADVKRYYDPTPLCRIDRGGVAAIARHVLTHQHQPHGGWKIEGLIEAAGVQRRADKVKTDMLAHASELAEMGIYIEGDRVFLATPAPSLATPAPYLPEKGECASGSTKMSTPAPSVSTHAPYLPQNVHTRPIF